MTSKRGITLNNCLGERVSVASRGKGFIQINGRGVLLPENEAIRLRDWLNAKYPAQPSAKDGVVCVEVSGLTGTGKSAVAGEIEVAMLALGLEVQWIEGDCEKRLNHADFAGELELYKPRVEIRERNIARPAVRGAEHE